MAYGTKYKGYWASQEKNGFLYIKEKDYVGAVTDIELKADSIKITYVSDGWEEHII